MTRLARLLTDLEAESADLDEAVTYLPAAGWSTPTPAEGWDVQDTITHLHLTDLDAVTALVDAEAFRSRYEVFLGHPDRYVDRLVEASRGRAPDELLAQWRQGRHDLLTALGRTDAEVRVPWFGPAMSVTSFATARLMETWAHGQDVADALARDRAATHRLRHVAEIGVRARRFSYANAGRAAPSLPLHVRLRAPDGEVWGWGPDDAADTIAGPALDFCLLVTRRRHLDDLALEATGQLAEEWLEIAQAFAGPSGAGRPPRSAADHRAGREATEPVPPGK